MSTAGIELFCGASLAENVDQAICRELFHDDSFEIHKCECARSAPSRERKRKCWSRELLFFCHELIENFLIS